MISESHIRSWILWLCEALLVESKPLTELDRERIEYIVHTLRDELNIRESAKEAEG